jgi:hypothetical protein
VHLKFKKGSLRNEEVIGKEVSSGSKDLEISRKEQPIPLSHLRKK